MLSQHVHIFGTKSGSFIFFGVHGLLACLQIHFKKHKHIHCEERPWGGGEWGLCESLNLGHRVVSSYQLRHCACCFLLGKGDRTRVWAQEE